MSLQIMGGYQRSPMKRQLVVASPGTPGSMQGADLGSLYFCEAFFVEHRSVGTLASLLT